MGPRLATVQYPVWLIGPGTAINSAEVPAADPVWTTSCLHLAENPNEGATADQFNSRIS